MATKIFRGDAQAVKQVDTYAVAGTWANADTITMTRNGKSIVITLGTTSASTIAHVLGAMVAAWNGSAVDSDETRTTTGDQIKEFTEAVASGTASPFTLTAKTAGVPWPSATITKVSASGTIAAVVNATVSAGPNHYDTAGNWSPSGVPGADDIVFTNCATDVLYGLGQGAVTPNTVRIDSTMTGKIGLPDINATGSYFEDRTKYLTFAGCTAGITLYDGDGAGTGRVKFDLGTAVAWTLTVNKTGTPTVQGIPSLLVKGGLAGCTLNAVQGSIGLATDAGSTANVPTINVGSKLSPSSDVTLVTGTGCTLTTITQDGGTLTLSSNVTTHTMTGGRTRLLAAATMGTLTQDGGSFYYESSGTMTSGTVRNKSTIFDCSRDPRGRTFTNLTVTKGAAFLDPNKTVTFTNPYATDRASLGVSDLGSAFSLQRS